MALFISSEPGMAVAVATQEDAGQTALLTVEGLPAGEVIVTGYDTVDSARVSSSPTIGGPHYLWALGQELSQITLTMMAFRRTCDNNGTYPSAYQFYVDNRIQPDRISPIKITFGGVSINGYLHRTMTRTTSERGDGLIIFTVELFGWVDETNLPATIPAEQAQANQDQRNDNLSNRGVVATQGPLERNGNVQTQPNAGTIPQWAGADWRVPARGAYGRTIGPFSNVVPGYSSQDQIARRFSVYDDSRRLNNFNRFAFSQSQYDRGRKSTVQDFRTAIQSVPVAQTPQYRITEIDTAGRVTRI